jgi:DNA gyrase/topoisomerase IV subunit B
MDNKKTIEEQYQKLSQREHVLHRPATYMGSVITDSRNFYVVEDINDVDNLKLVNKLIKYNPGFLKLYDEILTNASDHSIRTGKVKYIKVNVFDDHISIENDGPGIPIKIHEKEKIYVPELLFGNLLTSENYDDSVERMVGGLNGIGSKITNIFSTKFIVETADGSNLYIQEFSDNLSKIKKPKITKSKLNYTKITYYPDFKRFGLTSIDDEIRSILLRRILDVAVYCPKVKVYFNDKLIPVKSFKDYTSLFVEKDSEIFYEKLNDNWEICVGKSSNDNFDQISMVNGISTHIGGSHVNFITNTIVKNLKESLEKSNKKISIKPNDIKNKLFVFVNCRIGNPVFDTQTKENLTSKIVPFDLPDTLTKRLMKSEIIQSILEYIALREKQELSKLNKKTQKIRVNKLDDANKAGTEEGYKCSIFLSEGDSAQSTCLSGFSTLGRDYYGAFPLKGKPLNVRDAHISKIKENDEIKSIISILGLEFGKKYTSTKELRYGKVVFMSDADCLDENTNVITLDGIKKLRDVTYDDLVLTHTGEYKCVTNIISKQYNKYLNIVVNDNLIKCSEYHKFPILRDGIIILSYAKDILESDSLFLKNESIIEYLSIKPSSICLVDGVLDTIDITVEDDHSFFIKGDNDSILTHNCDGIHIKALLINLFDTFWPELLKLDFIYEFITPIVKVEKGKQFKYFYRLDEYKKWKLENTTSGFFIKYYKGLGTIQPDEAKSFFKDISKHLIKFNYTEDITSNLIDLGFNKKRSDDRKKWLLDYKVGNELDKFTTRQTYDGFINNELIEFSMADNIRSIPSLMDGFKPSQRKVLYGTILGNYKNEVKVALLCGSIISSTAYHHGNVSLEGCIIGMSQDYLNSNNVNLLLPKGQFGTRVCGGKDSASSRYIFTKLNDITRFIFRSEDDNLLNYLSDDGFPIEPEYYTPIVPMVLVNGSEGIGTGWSTFIPKYNLKDIITYLENKLNNKQNKNKLNPYVRGFKGTIVYDEDNNRYLTRGLITKLNTATLSITELPVGVWNDKYFEFIDKLVDDKVIKDYTKNCTDIDIDIKISVSRESMPDLEKDLYKIFGLESTISTNNMHLFDPSNKIKKYDSPEQIIEEYYTVRFDFYIKRKEYLLNKLENDRLVLFNRMKFIKGILDGSIVLNNKKREDIEKQVESLSIIRIEESFNYLFNMSLLSLTNEKLVELKESYNNKKIEIDNITGISVENMWLTDLKDLKSKLR